jgi:uncharacterized membrane protein (DUF485 family)
MTSMSQARVEEILSHPSFRKLTAARSALRLGSSLAVLIVFFGFIAMISTASAVFKKDALEGGIPLGMAAAFAVIAAFVVVTGIYVGRSNRTLDALTREVCRECGR